MNGATLTLGVVAGVVLASKFRPGSQNRWIDQAIQREGKLGGPGYSRKPWRKRKSILEGCMDEFGYMSCLRSLQILLNIDNMGPEVRKVIEHDRDWMVANYGEGRLHALRGRSRYAG